MARIYDNSKSDEAHHCYLPKKSDTPYYLKGSGYEPYSLFPWVVSDFGLVDAIESGLVKIPFKTFKGGKGGVPRPPKPKTIIKALTERSDLEIRFPNIIGYRSEAPDGEIKADYHDLPKFKIDFTKILGQYGRWAFVEVSDIDNIKRTLIHKIQEL